MTEKRRSRPQITSLQQTTQGHSSPPAPIFLKAAVNTIWLVTFMRLDTTWIPHIAFQCRNPPINKSPCS